MQQQQHLYHSTTAVHKYIIVLFKQGASNILYKNQISIPFKIPKQMKPSSIELQQTIVPPELKPNKKVICLKCAYSFDELDYEFHQQQCDGENEQIYYCPKIEDKEINFFNDIDLLDFPVSKASVQYNKFGKSGHESVALETKTRRSNTLKEQNCCFCSKDIVSSQKYVSLPCKHNLHTKCVKKWLIIVEPCKICNDSSDLSDTCCTERSLSSMKGSI